MMAEEVKQFTIFTLLMKIIFMDEFNTPESIEM
jgi:hypothetical protein